MAAKTKATGPRLQVKQVKSGIGMPGVLPVMNRRAAASPPSPTSRS